MPLTPGSEARSTLTVTDDDTAVALGSGDVPVLATPRLLAWLESATVAAVAPALAPADTSVGTRVERLEHLRATLPGATVTVAARLAAVDGRLLRFTAEATDEQGRLVASATITRVVVDRERFLERAREQ